MFTTSLGPEIVEHEAPEDVEGLMSISEAARVVVVEVRGVIFFFEDGLPKENERPGDVEVVGRPPFVPNAEESIPSLLSRGAFHEIVLGGLRESLVATLASGWDSHNLEPSTNWQAGSRRKYYMGGRWWLPRVRAVVSLVCQSACGLSQHPRVSRM
jgi:hypothetical protein